MSLTGFCCGVLSGMVASCPASGSISPHYSLVFGIFGAISCFFSVEFSKKLIRYKYDDTCDVFASEIFKIF